MIHNDVLEIIDSLNKKTNEYENKLRSQIFDPANKDKDIEDINPLLNQVKKIENFNYKLSHLKEEWSLITNDTDSKTVSENYEAYQRTNLEINGETVKITTRRLDGTNYSNVFPINLFKEICNTTLSFLKSNHSVKISDITNDLEKKIKEQSRYQKTPRMPVYATFKVLVKKQFLKVDDNNSRNYLLNSTMKEFSDWINSLDK